MLLENNLQKINFMGDVDYLRKDEIFILINKAFKNYNHYIWLQMLYIFGMLVSDLTSLKVENISIKDKTISLQDSKRLLPRILFIPNFLIQHLNIACFKKKPNDLVFEGRTEKIHERTIQKMLEKLSIGMRLDLSTKILRRSLAIHLLEDGIHVENVIKMLGYSSQKALNQLLGNYNLSVYLNSSPLENFPILLSRNK